MNLLVTGGSGFIGRAVVAELRRARHDVTVLTRCLTVEPALSDATLVQGDLTAEGFITSLLDQRGFDGICHLAGLTGVRDSFERPSTYFDVNVGGTVNLLKAVRARHARTGKPTRVVFASSRAIYARAGETAVPETHPAVPATPYGLSKRVIEQLLDFESRSGALGATSLRCFNVAGGGAGIADSDTRRLMPRLIGVIAGHLPPVLLSAPGYRRDFVHVIDVGRAFAMAIDGVRPGTSRVYNVGSGTGTSIGQVIALLEKAAGRPMPEQMTFAGDALDPDAVLADISLIRKDLGWAPRLTIENLVRDAWNFARVP